MSRYPGPGVGVAADDMLGDSAADLEGEGETVDVLGVKVAGGDPAGDAADLGVDAFGLGAVGDERTGVAAAETLPRAELGEGVGGRDGLRDAEVR